MSAAGRMCEAEQPGMQGLTRKSGDLGRGLTATGGGAPGPGAIEGIADQRVGREGGVNPDLMGAAGGESAFDERRLAGERAQGAIAGESRLSPAVSDNGHLFAIG